MVMPKAVVDEHGFNASFVDRFNAKLMRSQNGCLEWTGARYGYGYGHISKGPRGGGFVATHRAAWILAHGAIPPGLFVCHRCDNPRCCDVQHLFLGTAEENMADKVMKGRGRGELPSGERHPDARLTDDEVAQLRRDYVRVGNYAELGRRWGISKQHARALVLGLKRNP